MILYDLISYDFMSLKTLETKYWFINFQTISLSLLKVCWQHYSRCSILTAFKLEVFTDKKCANCWYFAILYSDYTTASGLRIHHRLGYNHVHDTNCFDTLVTLAGIEPATVALQARRPTHRANQPLVNSHLNEFITLTAHAKIYAM